MELLKLNILNIINWKERLLYDREMREKNVQINVHKNVQINDYEKLTKIEKEILEIIIENPKITQVNIANRLGTAPKTVQRGIATLKTKGIIERVGSNKKGYWEIKK